MLHVNCRMYVYDFFFGRHMYVYDFEFHIFHTEIWTPIIKKKYNIYFVKKKLVF